MNVHTLKTDTQYITDLQSTLSNFWELESSGMKQDCNSIRDKFLEDISYDGERYQVKFPWKNPHTILPAKYNLSMGRLKGTMKRLKQQPEALHLDDTVIKEQLEKGTVERVPLDDRPPAGKVHYLPHHRSCEVIEKQPTLEWCMTPLHQPMEHH